MDSNNQSNSQNDSKDDINSSNNPEQIDLMVFDLPTPPIDANNDLSNQTGLNNSFNTNNNKHITRHFPGEEFNDNFKYNNSQCSFYLPCPPMDNFKNVNILPTSNLIDHINLSNTDEKTHSIDKKTSTSPSTSISTENYSQNRFYTAREEFNVYDKETVANSLGMELHSSYSFLKSNVQTLFACSEFQDKIIEIYCNFVKCESINCENKNEIFLVTLKKLNQYLTEITEKEIKDIVERLYQYLQTPLVGNINMNYDKIIKYLYLKKISIENSNITGITLQKEVKNISINNSTKNYQESEIYLKTKKSDKFPADIYENDHSNNSDSTDDDKNEMDCDDSNHPNSYFNSLEIRLSEEKLESDFIADSIKQIIELNKNNKIYVLLGLLFSCTLFRNIMINFHKNNEIKKLFKRFAVVDIGIFVNSICIIYDHVTGQKEIGPIIQLDKNLSIHQCFNYIFDNIKFIMENKEFNKAIKFNSLGNFKIICDNFYGTVLFETICSNCSKSHKFEDYFSNLCVKKPQNKSSVNLEKCLIEYGFEINCQQDEKCCENPEIFLLRKIIHAPKILFICVDEQSRNSNPDCILNCDSIMQIDTLAGPVTYSLVSILDQNDSNMYDVKFLGNSGWWQAYPHSRKINDFDLFTKYNVGFLFKKLG